MWVLFREKNETTNIRNHYPLWHSVDISDVVGLVLIANGVFCDL